MIFSSILFLFVFLPITLLVYFIVGKRFKNFWLLCVSLFFYSWGEPKYIVLMLLSVFINYVLGISIEKVKLRFGKKGARWVLVFTVACNLGLLLYYKYFDFFVENFNVLFSTDIPLKHIALPVGISFYTFQSMSYVIDVYREETEAQYNILDLALYISFFPQLIAGPIVRYVDIKEQLRNHYWGKGSFDKLYSGVRLFMIGFSKKILLADQLAPLADAVFAINGGSALCAWLGAIAYTFQIFFDFSGYSDMARGLGRMFGFEFVENFNYPYISKSIKEFWRRWHISLSTWFRDYVYIPLGGNRVSTLRSYINLTVVFFLTGFWHGASWNFIVWGLYYVVFQVLEKLNWGKLLVKLPAALQHLYALVVVIIGWVFFRAEDLQHAVSYIKNMFVVNGDVFVDVASNMNAQYVFCLAVAAVLSIPWKKKLTSNEETGSALGDVAVILIFVIAVSYMIGNGFSPFLYFRF